MGWFVYGFIAGGGIAALFLNLLIKDMKLEISRKTIEIDRLKFETHCLIERIQRRNHYE